MDKHQKPFIVARDIQRSFTIGDQTTHVLKGVSLEIPRGQFVTIMGPSGSGKSTLMYLLGGLDRPSSGEIIINGQSITQMTSSELAHFRRDTNGFIFQSFYLIPTLTALENVALPGIFAGKDADEREERAAKLLTFLGMGDRLTHRPSQLSGGQQQRVAIGRSLFNNPPIIMGDEPTGALDTKTGNTVLKLLQRLNRKQKKTIILVTHDPAVADYGNRLIRIQDGLILEDKLIEQKIS